MRYHKSFIASLLPAACALLFAPAPLRADVRLPKLFTDNMVLEQRMKAPIWGWASDGEEVTVTFRGQKVKTVAKDGKWLVRLGSLKAGGPDELTVSGKNSITIRNVLVGEVWVCSGQSNMEFPLQNSFEAKQDIEASANSVIHLFHVRRVKADVPTNDVDASWQECDPKSSAHFSAVGYYFGRDLQKALRVPIGLIESDWGGSPAEAWTREEVLSENPRYKKEILEGYTKAFEHYQEAKTKFDKESADAKAAGKPFEKHAPGAPWKPAELYNGMIAPLVPYGIKGAIWYQGESNAGRAEQYRALFADMIRNWRQDWNEGDFTFLAVQLAPYMSIKDQPVESSWAELREAQGLAAKVLPNAGVAVITDVGDPANIHPTKKRPVGERLALAARGIAYGQKLVYSGPAYHSMRIKDGSVILSFDNVGSGLEARDGALKGFAICGDDHKFVWADAKIDGKTVVVSCASVPKPVAVRYGWADCPVVNLWNKDGLPASPFRTDDFPMITAGKF